MKSRKFITGLLVAATVLSSAAPVCAEEVTNTTEITEVGSTSSSVSMTYADEHGDYIPTDNFTVTIPKTFSVNPKEDYVYDVNVQGTIDVDRDVWVCTDDTVTLTLTDETLADTYGINKTQTVANTIDKIQYSSEKIADAEGYTQQGTIAKSSLDYEVECEYAGSISFYINVIGDENLLENSISQNGYMSYSSDVFKQICRDILPEEVYNSIKDAEELTVASEDCDYCIIGTLDYTPASESQSFDNYEIEVSTINNKYTLESITHTCKIVNGKYCNKYNVSSYMATGKQTTLTLQYDSSSHEIVNITINDTSYAGGGGASEEYHDKAFLYLSPRCKYKYE